MKILVIGSGGREHAIVWKLKQSTSVSDIYVSPGNGGVFQDAQLFDVKNPSDIVGLARRAKELKIDLTIVGPEALLAQGIVDHFRNQGLLIFGPDRRAAQLESSKVFAKRFMQKHNIPTANFEVFSDARQALVYCQSKSKNPEFGVIKADGLAAGKGVFVCQSFSEAQDAIEQMMVRKVFGSASDQILVEDKLVGEEISLMAFCDGKTIKPLPFARDYKRVFDGQKGPNTGGMGAVAPVIISSSVKSQIENQIFARFISGLQSENIDYRGVIYFGLMMTESGPKVLEFNARFGDPETQVVLPLIESDLLPVLLATSEQKLSAAQLELSSDACVSVVCASGGYPGPYQTHKQIWGLESAKSEKHNWVFHAGTIYENGQFYTQGGRVLNVVSRRPTVSKARQACYELVDQIRFEAMHVRRDIALGL